VCCRGLFAGWLNPKSLELGWPTSPCSNLQSGDTTGLARREETQIKDLINESLRRKKRGSKIE
jgi:hypothetical protein